MATLTLRNVPEELYERLKAQATMNRRSLNQEAIAILERNVAKRPRTPEEQAELFARLAADGQRDRLAGVWLDAESVKEMINGGRR